MINQKIFKQILPKLYSICQETGLLQMKHHKSNISFSTKDNKTPVTEIDIKSNSIITKGLNEPDIHGSTLLIWALSMIYDFRENTNVKFNILRP